MSDIRAARAELLSRILEGSGTASVAQRRAAFENAEFSEPLRSLVRKVATDSDLITDGDFRAIRSAGLSEDAIFELVVCAAVGQASRQYDAALNTLERALEGEHFAS